jgi:hypothetical protein
MQRSISVPTANMNSARPTPASALSRGRTSAGKRAPANRAPSRVGPSRMPASIEYLADHRRLAQRPRTQSQDARKAEDQSQVQEEKRGL